MKLTFLEIVLLIALVIGVVRATPIGMEHYRLDSEYARMQQFIGEFPIADRTKINLLKVKTKDKLHFVWKVYIPAKMQLKTSGSVNDFGRFVNPPAREFIAFVHFYENDVHGGPARATYSFESIGDIGLGRSCRILSNLRPEVPIEQFLRKHWDELEYEELDTSPGVALAPHALTMLLRVKLPEELTDQFRNHLPPEQKSKFNGVLFEVQVGS